MNYKTFIPAFIFALALSCAPNAKAGTSLSAGDLIKGSLPAVYYYSQAGTRLVFPTEKTFFTWFANFNNVKTISDADLAAIPLGGNVTYKPGVKLIKITTDPKTYAISAGGTLRHLTSEALAIELYGADWNTKIDDIPDAFFINYNIGSPLNSSADLNPAEEIAKAATIDADREQHPTPPVCTTCNTEPETPTSTEPIATLTTSNTAPQAGDLITLTAITNYAKGIKLIKLYFNGGLITTCDYASTCVGNMIIDKNTASGVYEARAEITAVDYTSYNPTLNITVSADTSFISDKAHIKINRSSVKIGQSTTVTIDADVSLLVRRLEIFVNGSGKYVCETGVRTCSYAAAPTGGIGTITTVYGIITDTLGRTYRTVDETITIADNDSPAITIQSGKSTIYKNETIDITVGASDDDGILYLEILDAGKNSLKRCNGAAPCTFTSAPITQTGIITFYGRAADVPGLIEEQSIDINVTNP